MPSLVEVGELQSWLALHRHSWYILPTVMAGYIVLGLAMVPVIALIAMTGLVFGPVLGPLYAMAGCLASGATGFAIGRAVGLRRIEQLGSRPVARLIDTLQRNGTIAVFLVRKVPAPFMLVNIVIGASTVRFRDFIIGTVLGMGAFVIALAGFGYTAAEALRDPSVETLMIAATFVTIPLVLAFAINRALRPKTAG